MEGALLKINTIDVDVYNGHSVYRNQPFANDYGSSQSTAYNFNGFEPQLHATETRFLMESLNVATQPTTYSEFDMPPANLYAQPTAAPPSTTHSGPSSASGSHRSDSDDDDGDDGDLDTSKLTKEELRKHKNRQSAARSRKRNRDRMGQLEALVRQLSVKNRQLEEQVQALLLERATVERHSHIAPPPPHQPHHSYHHVHTQPHAPSHLPVHHTPYYH
jgi:hypothetical protein